jgi:hypothetical protein
LPVVRRGAVGAVRPARRFHPRPSLLKVAAVVDCGLLGLVGGRTKVQGWRRQDSLHTAVLAEEGPCSGVTFREGAMTVAELIEKLSALPDKTARVVKSAGPWDLNEPGLIYDSYLDRDMHFPVQATEPDAIHVVYL